MDAASEAWVERARSVPIAREVERRGIKLRGRIERVGPCPRCGGVDRFAINVKKGVWNCRGCGVGGDVIRLVEYLDGVEFIAACETLTGEPPPKANGKTNDATARKVIAEQYRYETEDGALAFVVERIEYQLPDGNFIVTKEAKRKKSFRQKRPDPDRPDAWIWNVDGALVVPYRLPQITEAIANGCPILIVEGERKADLLWSWNIPATCCAGGAKKWLAEHAEYLRSADVVLVPDNDNAGWEHANHVGAGLVGIAARVRVLALPGLPPKGDIIDWVAAGGTREQLDALVDGAADWIKPVPEGDDRAKATAREDQLLEALARMAPGIEFARERAKLAKDFGVTRGAIDDELETRRSGSERATAPLHGHWIVEPWPELVDADSLLRDIIRRVRKHVIIGVDDALAIALWIMLAWVHDEVATHSPILNINSAEPESGKSTTLGLVSFLTPRCVSSVEISEAALYRAIKLWQPSFAIDEFDAVLASDDKVALRSVINSGHTRGTGVVRCIGDEKTPELFPTFCPKAIGMCGRKLPAATLSRCIFVELRTKKSTEKAERFEHKDDAGLAELRRRLARWAIDNEDALCMASPAMPVELQNRRADNWRLQFAIADSALADWGEKARAAALKIEGKTDSRTIGVRLLADIKRLFDMDAKAHCMHSATMVERLVADPEKPWVELTRGKPLTQGRLARLLGAYRITSQTVTPTGLKDGKGYYREQFEDVWARYLATGLGPTDPDISPFSP